MRLRDFLLLDEGPERDKIAAEKSYKFGIPNYSDKIPTSFKDEPKKVRVIASPTDRNKSEKQITQEHEWFFNRLGILFFHTKVKGEVHSIGKGKAILKASENKGFFDMILLINGKIFVGLELKAGDGGYVSEDQLKMHKRVSDAGGYVLVSNSVRITEQYLKQNNLIK